MARQRAGETQKDKVREALMKMVEDTYLSSVEELIDSMEDREMRQLAKAMDMANDESLREELESHLARARNAIIKECATSGDVKKMEFAMKMIGTEKQRQRQNSVYKSDKKNDNTNNELPTIVLMDATTNKSMSNGKDKEEG